MPIDVFWQVERLPKDVWVPDQGVAPYGRRGSDAVRTGSWPAREALTRRRHFRFRMPSRRDVVEFADSPTLYKVAAARERPISYAATCVRARSRIGVSTLSARARATMSPKMCSPSVVEPRSMSRSIDHFSGDPAAVMSAKAA